MAGSLDDITDEAVITCLQVIFASKPNPQLSFQMFSLSATVGVVVPCRHVRVV